MHDVDALKAMGGFARRRASQGTELPWLGNWSRRLAYVCSSLRDNRSYLWAGNYRMVHMVGDRHAAQQPKLGDVKTFSTSKPNGVKEYWGG